MWTLVIVAVLGSIAAVQSEPTWTSLRVTWGINLLSSRVFAKLPFTENKARSDGFVRLAGSCSGGKFMGHRYMKGTDTTAVPIYDANGYIAGIQHGIPKNDATTHGEIKFDRIAAYTLDKILGEEEVYFITTYFVDPRIICNGGRTAEEYEEQGVGTALYVQNGTDSIKDSVQIPMYEEEDIVQNGTSIRVPVPVDENGTALWTKGGCFRTMGVHYWYRVHEDMSCNDFFPITAIYNRGKLTSFAFVSPGKYEFSRRFEHPSSSALSSFLPDPVPKCLYEEYDRVGGFSTMHVFFSVRPWNVLC